MNSVCYIELCIYCEQINADDQPVYCRIDESVCPKCGLNEWVLLNPEVEFIPEFCTQLGFNDQRLRFFQ